MKLKDLLHWTKKEDAWIALSKSGFASLHPDIMVFIGEISGNWKAFKGHVQEVLELFGKSNIIFIEDEEDVMLVSSKQSWNLPNSKAKLQEIFNVETESKRVFPNPRLISRDDFLGKTTHIKLGDKAFSRGFIEDGAWRPAYKGTDQFEGWVYDVRVPNEILRDYTEFKEVAIAEMGGPICITIGPVRVRLSRENTNVEED